MGRPKECDFPKAPTTTGIVVAFIPHIRSISISRSLYLDSFPVIFTELFLSIGMAISMYNIYAFCSSKAEHCALLTFLFSVGQCQDHLNDCYKYANHCSYDHVKEQCPLTCTLCGKFST